jgi:hypothetical protein
LRGASAFPRLPARARGPPDSRFMSESGQARPGRPAVQKSEDAELRGFAEVAVVQAADFGKLHNLARYGELDGSEVGGVLVQR